MLPARGVAGFLHIHAEIDLVDEHLHVALRLHRAAHEAEGFPRRAVLQHEAGDNRLERALARRVDVGVARFEGEEFAAILEGEAEAGHRDAGAHAAVVRLDERHHVALGVCGAQIDGVAILERGVAGVIGAGGAGGVDKPAPLGGVGLREQALQRNLGERRVGVELRAVLEGELLGLDQQVQGVGGAVAHLREVEAFEDVEHLERGDALRVGRQLIDVVAAVIDGDGFDPGGLVVLEVGLAEKTAVGAHEGVDLIGDLALVEGVAALFRDQAERVRQRRVLEDLTLVWSAPLLRQGFGGQTSCVDAVSLEESSGKLVGLGVAHADAPEVADVLGDGEALVRVADGRREQVLHRQLAELAVQREPAVDGTRHGDRQKAAGRDVVRRGGLRQLGLHLLVAEPERGTARGVEAVELLGLRIVNDGEEIAAHAVAHRFHQTECRIRGNGRVHGGAAGFEDIESGLRGERVAGADHAVRAEHGRAGGEGATVDAVDLGAEQGAEDREQKTEQGGPANSHGGTLDSARAASTRVRARPTPPCAWRRRNFPARPAPR